MGKTFKKFKGKDLDSESGKIKKIKPTTFKKKNVNLKNI